MTMIEGPLPCICPSCEQDRLMTKAVRKTLQAIDDAELLNRVASLLYETGDPRAVAWPDAQTLGKLRHDLRTLADAISDAS
jgi:hypothetical protein